MKPISSAACNAISSETINEATCAAISGCAVFADTIMPDGTRKPTVAAPAPPTTSGNLK